MYIASLSHRIAEYYKVFQIQNQDRIYSASSAATVASTLLTSLFFNEFQNIVSRDSVKIFPLFLHKTLNVPPFVFKYTYTIRHNAVKIPYWCLYAVAKNTYRGDLRSSADFDS